MPSESNPPYPLPGRPFDLPKPEAPYRPAYFKNTIPSYWRRDKNHDYTRRCIYLLTMRKAPDMPDFSNVFAPDGNPFKPQISLSPLGAIIYHEIHSLSVSFPSVKVFDSVVMPDHIHFVVYLSESGMHPGDIVKKFKGHCSRAWQRLQRPLRTSTATDIRGHNAALNAIAARIASGNAILRKPTGCSAGCTQARHGRQSRVFISFFFRPSLSPMALSIPAGGRG